MKAAAFTRRWRSSAQREPCLPHRENGVGTVDPPESTVPTTLSSSGLSLGLKQETPRCLALLSLGSNPGEFPIVIRRLVM
jgi:hypothetical protein